jgi:hypothetical protein
MKENSIFDLVSLSLKLDECHKTMKALYGPEFEGHVMAMAPMLFAVASTMGGNVIAGALKTVKGCDDGSTVALILAVAVELTHRQNAEQAGRS